MGINEVKKIGFGGCEIQIRCMDGKIYIKAMFKMSKLEHF